MGDIGGDGRLADAVTGRRRRGSPPCRADRPSRSDRRDPRLLEHTVETLVGQRVFALALGYEDLNDHDELRHDPLFHVLAGKLEAKRSDCAPVAGKSTLNRLEHRPRREAGKYHKIDYDAPSLEALFVDIFLDGHKRAPKEIVLDLDATRGKACFGKTRQMPRKCVTRPLRLRRGVASGTTGGHEKPREEWIEIPVPAIVSEETFALAEERLEMNKIHAPRRTRRSVRRIKFAMASGFPWQTEFALAYLYLQRAFPR